MSDTYAKYPVGKCPRCGGFLYSAVYSAGRSFRYVMRDKVKCENCARYWRLVNGVMVMWPARDGDTVVGAVEPEPPRRKRRKAINAKSKEKACNKNVESLRRKKRKGMNRSGLHKVFFW